jgi:hypothetical protein
MMSFNNKIHKNNSSFLKSLNKILQSCFLKRSIFALSFNRYHYQKIINLILKEFQRHSRNPRILFLPAHALRGLNEIINFGLLEHEFKRAW